MTDENFELVEGSGNIFRDFGDPEADLKQAKAILAARIIAVLDERGLSVRKAASITGFAAADFSRIRNANLGRFTLDRMIRMIGALDDHIRVTIQVGLRAEDPATTTDVKAGTFLSPAREGVGRTLVSHCASNKKEWGDKDVPPPILVRTKTGTRTGAGAAGTRRRPFRHRRSRWRPVRPCHRAYRRWDG